VPEDVSALIEAVYDDTRPCPTVGPAGLAERWSATWDALQTSRRKHESTARQVLIHPPDAAEDGFLATWNRQLEEDDPQIHRDLQALTRLGEQSVTAICLTPEEIARLRPRDADAWARAAPLLHRSVGLTDKRIVHDLAKMTPPSPWKSTALLRYCRLIELDAHGEAAIGKWRLRIHPELGAQVIGQGEE
jgi:CRISPR-associated endonuclease/helicase Cas3